MTQPDQQPFEPSYGNLYDPPTQPIQPVGRNRAPRRLLAIIAGVVLAITGGTITLVLTLSEPDTFTVHGTLSVFGGCGMGYGGFSDLAAGAQVVVFDSHRTVLGTGTLERSDDTGTSDVSSLPECTFTFTVADIPAGLERYGVHVGNRNRGVIWQSEAEARTGFYLSIG